MVRILIGSSEIKLSLNSDLVDVFPFRHESAIEPDEVPPGTGGHVPRDPGGRDTDPVHPDAPRPAHGRPETV